MRECTTFFCVCVFLCLKTASLVFYTRTILTSLKEMSPKLSIKIPDKFNYIPVLLHYDLIVQNLPPSLSFNAVSWRWLHTLAFTGVRTTLCTSLLLLPCCLAFIECFCSIQLFSAQNPTEFLSFASEKIMFSLL